MRALGGLFYQLDEQACKHYPVSKGFRFSSILDAGDIAEAKVITNTSKQKSNKASRFGRWDPAAPGDG